MAVAEEGRKAMSIMSHFTCSSGSASDTQLHTIHAYINALGGFLEAFFNQ